MKLLFCAAVLFPFTFWIIIKLLPSKVETPIHRIDMCIISNEHEVIIAKPDTILFSLARSVR